MPCGSKGCGNVTWDALLTPAPGMTEAPRSIRSNTQGQEDLAHDQAQGRWPVVPAVGCDEAPAPRDRRGGLGNSNKRTSSRRVHLLETLNAEVDQHKAPTLEPGTEFYKHEPPMAQVRGQGKAAGIKHMLDCIE